MGTEAVPTKLLGTVELTSAELEALREQVNAAQDRIRRTGQNWYTL